MNLDPVLVAIVASLGRIIAEIVKGTLGKESAYRELSATAELLRGSLEVDAIARGELAGDVAESGKFSGRP